MDLFEILLVEDNPGDVDLMREALAEGDGHNRLHVARDGAQALAFLRRETGFADAPRPDLVLLDLNLPGVTGREVLKTVKFDPGLRSIPIVVMTSSAKSDEVCEAYDFHANCYVRKPVDLDRFVEVVRGIESFWFSVARLPGR